MLLEIDLTDKEYPLFTICEKIIHRFREHYYYENVLETLISLVYKWKHTYSKYDGQISGVLADCIEEELSMDTPLQTLVDHLRMRFNSYKFNSDL
jgi:hypothetical protein